MPMWPFGRRGAKAAKLKDGRAAVAEGKGPAAVHGLGVASHDALKSTPTRRSSRRKRRTSRAAASLRDTAKASPDRPLADIAFETLPRSSADHITALPFSKRLEQSPHLRPVTQAHGIPYNFHTHSHSSLTSARERGKLQRPQSLRKPITESLLVRRKSSKKREHDPVREEEIRAMSMPLAQKRPAGSSGSMLRRESKKVKGGLNHRFERPSSDISLPLEDSIHSSMSGNSETRAFRVSAFDMFSPRPTIRSSVGSQYCYGGVGASPTSYTAKGEVHKERRTTASRHGAQEKRTSRVDDLADSLDAGALREILERDKRRRDKKRKADDERLLRKLERRAEKQRAAEALDSPAVTPRRAAREIVGLGIEKDTPTPMEDIRPSTPPQRQPHRLETDAVAPAVEENNQLPTPLDSPVEEVVVSDAKAVRYSRGSVSSPTHTRAPSNVSHLPELLSEKIARQTPVESIEPVHDPRTSGSLHPVVTTDTATTSKKGSSRRRSSEGRRMRIWAALFRRGKRTSREPTPSEISFSNTSRESMSRQPLPSHLVATMPTSIPPVPIRQSSSVPRRTMSKFREDLPEFPLSPPDSRMQSPETTFAGATAIAARRRTQPPSAVQVTSTSSGSGGRTDSPVSPGVPPTGLMSQSLASVDSEASWLSGKPLKRQSNNSHPRFSVGSSSAVKRNEDFSASYEELGIPDDEYFRRLTPQPDERRRSALSGDLPARKASSTAIATIEDAADSDHDNEDVPAAETVSAEGELVHTGVARQPTIIHRRARVKSTEALLSYFQPDKIMPEDSAARTEEVTEQDSPTSEGEPNSPTSDGEPVSLQRATSIELGKHHVRHLSAGSARLLEIQKRSSTASQNR
ncbi:hypothetical protein BDV95DRAFT_594829 [Massariosphaeria phaeospora]|uniref:Uncharacterized protein n=1 Tax=Massariosphaeria phaeospora TaxID=100035 RepID=A0A7C8I653_9PLEO|nr:hypothetical protein BDV95DRAFT_594829 [Massariosphaeria phaeospora]